MKKKGDTQEGLHPSRDVGKGPGEYELPYGGNEGVNFPGFGYVEKGELGHYDEIYKQSPSDYPEMAPIMQPRQGRLFDPDKVEGANRSKLGRKRFEVDDPYDEGDQSEGAQLRDRALLRSKIPSKDLQSRKGWTMETELEVHDSFDDQGQGWQGWYRGPASETRADRIAIRNDLDINAGTNTFVHEAGHRKHLGEIKNPNSPLISHPRGVHPDPLKEGVADAYADRYGGPEDHQVQRMSNDIESGEPKFTSYQYTGYSTDSSSAIDRDWHGEDRALYAATRAHASETGEQALYKPGPPSSANMDVVRDPSVDATLHHLLTTSPHAQQAVKDTGLEHIGQQAVQRHQDRMLLHRGQEIQGAMFEEHHSAGMEGSAKAYSVDPEAAAPEHRKAAADESFNTSVKLHDSMGPNAMTVTRNMQHNQFGETPRKIEEVYGTLGVYERHSASRGFV